MTHPLVPQLRRHDRWLCLTYIESQAATTTRFTWFLQTASTGAAADAMLLLQRLLLLPLVLLLLAFRLILLLLLLLSAVMSSGLTCGVGGHRAAEALNPFSPDI